MNASSHGPTTNRLASRGVTVARIGSLRTDIVAPDSSGNLKMWTHNAGEYLNAPVQVPGGWNFSQTTAADSTGDGKADLVAQDGSRDLKRWLGRGDGSLGAATLITSGR